ncbi:hypothetical protein SAMN05216378_3183 [Paenibacillus catalpae]|uniref:Uncharacterized protein n=1 Tax=Paenibacillus catalpae TaxID=1045775 RepID=A0A1I2ARR7_9BACL|nr:hypothetical protein SAMN05216378_3183 [Paenibacillus catalpae]
MFNAKQANESQKNQLLEEGLDGALQKRERCASPDSA